ncbi:MAG: hypothetical protein E6J91_10205 [Deltaproteobacteria bacterium]|nr:MAG: hypothetical protein E6J91_10205 [Deltaproteobacteria bacterium]
MRLRELLEAVAEISPEAFEDLRRDIDPEWVLQALEATGTATLRTRRLPAEQVVWLVIGMALFRNRSIHEVVSKLDLALPGISLTVAPSTVVEARAGWAQIRWSGCSRSPPSIGPARALACIAGMGWRSTGLTGRPCGYLIRQPMLRTSGTPAASVSHIDDRFAACPGVSRSRGKVGNEVGRQTRHAAARRSVDVRCGTVLIRWRGDAREVRTRLAWLDEGLATSAARRVPRSGGGLDSAIRGGAAASGRG